jgi:hypothetical protein
VEEEADLVVDGDDSTTYGPPQYSEADVVMTSADGPREEKEREALREALIRYECSRVLCICSLYWLKGILQFSEITSPTVPLVLLSTLLMPLYTLFTQFGECTSTNCK